MAANYENAKIYKLYNFRNKKYYIGSTCSELFVKKYAHYIKAKKNPTCKLNKEILKLGWKNDNNELIWHMKLIELYPSEKEGVLDKKLASLVNKNKCLEVAKTISLEKFILVGNKNSKAKVENKIIADSIEALIGAIYYDKGFEVVEKFILNML